MSRSLRRAAGLSSGGRGLDRAIPNAAATPPQTRRTSSIPLLCRSPHHKNVALLSTTTAWLSRLHNARQESSMPIDMLSETSIDPQTNCRLLLAPYDIRRAIYLHLLPTRVHISISQHSKLCLSSCLGTSLEDACPEDQALKPPWPSIKENCNPYLACIRNPVWGRRLHSRWGPHWKCEEESEKLKSRTWLPLILVCKKL
jgi:hypothetical protein